MSDVQADGDKILHQDSVEDVIEDFAGSGEIDAVITPTLYGEAASNSNVLFDTPDRNLPQVYLQSYDSGSAKVQITFATKDLLDIQLPGLPTADPHVAGKLWNNAGTLKISAG